MALYFATSAFWNREHGALSCPRTEWINLPCNHLLSRHPQATEERFGFGCSLLIGVNAFKLLWNNATISTTLLRNLYFFVWQSPSFYFMRTGRVVKSQEKIGKQCGTSDVFDYPMWANAMHLRRVKCVHGINFKRDSLFRICSVIKACNAPMWGRTWTARSFYFFSKIIYFYAIP